MLVGPMTISVVGFISIMQRKDSPNLHANNVIADHTGKKEIDFKMKLSFGCGVIDRKIQ